MKHILITGASGLIGRHTIALLLKDSDVAISGLYNENLPAFSHDRVTWIKANLKGGTIPGVRSDDINAVIHCAALSPTSVYSDELCYEINKPVDKTVLDFCEANSNIRVIFLSSIYLERYTEDDLWLKSKYLYQKRQSEYRLMTMKNKWASLRISSPYGIHQTYRNVFKQFMEKALNGENLIVHGTGSRTQDFVAADDVAEAIHIILRGNTTNGIYNICSSEPVSMKQLAEIIASAADRPVEVLMSGKPDSQEDYRVNFDNSEAKARLGWTPHTSLKKGISSWFNYLKQ